MAKKIASKGPVTPAKKASAPKKKTTPAKSSSTPAVDQVCAAALHKLRELSLDFQLQGEIEWCLASYANDGNPVGLYEMAERALREFNNLVASQPRAVPAKLIADLKKVVTARP